MPGQLLHIVNNLYPYAVQFKEDPASCKRPLDVSSKDKEGCPEAPSLKAAKKHEHLPESVRAEESREINVRHLQLRML